jgi:hypothetical protein
LSTRLWSITSDRFLPPSTPLVTATLIAKWAALRGLAARGELDRLSRTELCDVAWYLAQQVHDLADDPDGDMIELQCAIDYVQARRKPSAVTLRKRD